MSKKVWIIGIRGVPAEHGGFETFAERFALYAQDKGWEVNVFCQKFGKGETTFSEWNGVKQINIFSHFSGALGTLYFDLKSIFHAARSRSGVALVLGYNSAVLNAMLKLFGIKVVINMDGFEWKRKKWSWPYKVWFYINERLGVLFADRIVLDHPELSNYFDNYWPKRPRHVIAYGGDKLIPDESHLGEYGLKKDQFYLVIARPEPENNILFIVESHVLSKTNIPLVILGNYDESNAYHKKILKTANQSEKGNIIFLGAIYDAAKTFSMRHFCKAYIHGHVVGGTNPSLVESIVAQSRLIAHDNRFNRWVAQKTAHYFDDQYQLITMFRSFEVEMCDNLVEHMRCNAKRFEWPLILEDYCKVLEFDHD